ncbi:MAG: 1-(5-phosphoribosyl)-5-[(5-phosphoribosylamino)methylideneamino]imidazole-4-carboxamide isomerase [Albidovulum sp.]|nr:1-(5-phosphoribosyl)-5-[(5-phosphoribosylamino)methylideneamino]imidazole-4-carboxamide isomerase [Albidovulum sp.]MDE0531433.1 1-(5-phosphoribosyl)-5-[(5-phosphoribosylamino)methylideneamino]imidazole-4-carboxamide isomerase [Albidovulum sp.]
MILYPAIDLKEGQCVRLYKGDMAQSTVFHKHPELQARIFRDSGCEWLHLVDLNGAIEGKPINHETVGAILSEVDIPVQLGGGIRSFETIEFWISSGVRRIVLGTAAVEDPALLKAASKKFPGRIAAGIDARDGKAATRGWVEISEIPAKDVARRYEDTGVAVIVYTDIGRDGTMEGPNIEATAGIVDAVDIPVIASGGVSRLQDLKDLKSAIPNLDGIISGRAIYDRRFDLKDALAVLDDSR